MPMCSAWNCPHTSDRRGKNNPFSYHRFPHSDPVRLKVWVHNLKRKNFTPGRGAILCSAHFEESCFDRTGQTIRLRNDAIPTIFSFPAHLQKIPCKPRRPLRRMTATEIEGTQKLADASRLMTTDGAGNRQPSSLAPTHQAATGKETTGQGPASATVETFATFDHSYSTTKCPKKRKRTLKDSSVAMKTSTPADHCYSINESPRKMKRKLDEAIKTNEQLKKKLRASQQTTRRMKKKVASLQQVVDALQQKRLISDGCAEMLNSLAPVQQDLLLRQTEKTSGAYSAELKAFAATLQFYSAKAYKFVRKTFKFCLPHPAQIRKWYSKLAAGPGFTDCAFTALKLRASDAKSKGREVICNLTMDEMTLMKHVEWDGSKYQGYVNLGTNDMSGGDNIPLAKDAYVLMVVAVNDSWKVPCGYFFINSLTGNEKANIVTESLRRLHDTGVKVVSLTCDGPSCNFTMLRALGAEVDPTQPNFDPSFVHPSDASSRVQIMLDACHMLKLVRNTLGDLGVLIDKNGKAIRWSHLVSLNELQKTEGLRLGNKLTDIHINFQKQKMKVNLAAQTLSASVADALQYCSKNLGLPDFSDCDGLIEFTRMFDKLFDALNSRNPFAKGQKAPLRHTNINEFEPFLHKAKDYILNLRDKNGILMVNTRRQTGFVGFICCIDSTLALFHSLVNRKDAPLKYLLTYKFSQDHLELFFCAIRACGGWNNNPTTAQFTAAYKRLLMRHNIQASNGNCEQIDNTKLLHMTDQAEETCTQDKHKGKHSLGAEDINQMLTRNNIPVVNSENLNDDGILYRLRDAVTVDGKAITTHDVEVARRNDLTPKLTDEDDLEDMENIIQTGALHGLSNYKEAAVAYIAGYVCKMAEKRLSCEKCQQVLRSSDQRTHCFVLLKDRGGLHKPSTDVTEVCSCTEKYFQRILKTSNSTLTQVAGLKDAVSSAVLSDISGKVFHSLHEHMFETEVENNHVHSLIKTISQCYCKIRCHHLAKQLNENITGTKVRKNLSKLILFKHQ